MRLLGRPLYLVFIIIVYLYAIPALAFTPTPGDTIQDDIAREFSGSPGTINDGTVATTAPTVSTCSDILQSDESAGEIPTGEQCSCPSGATQPVCVESSATLCSANLAEQEQALGSNQEYYDCTCASGASTASCPSYYSLCEANLPNYQTSFNECSCANPDTNSVPSCVSDYSICENNAAQYENSTTTCSCSQTSTQPYCCTSTTTQQCSTTQQCTTSQGPCTGAGTYTCNPVGGENFYATCSNMQYDNSSSYTYTIVSRSAPVTFSCSGSQPWPGCQYYNNSGGNTVTPPSNQTCPSPVTTCTPVTTCPSQTTQSCVTEP